MQIFSLLSVISYKLLFSAIGILGIGFLIGFHELGHFLFAQLFNVKAPSFSIGFGPRLMSKKWGETTFSLSAIPLGGYVEIAGMAEVAQGDQKEATRSDERSFNVKPLWQKLCILFGGILFNLIFAYIALALLFWVGAPKSRLVDPRLGITTHAPTISMIAPHSPAEEAGLKAGDTIIAIDQENVGHTTDTLLKQIESRPNQQVNLTITRDKETINTSATLDTRTTINQQGNTKEVGTLGVVFAIKEIKQLSFVQACRTAGQAVWLYATGIGQMIKRIICKRTVAGMGGPIAVISQTSQGAQQGWKIFLLFLAIISINLAVLNLVPLPILDGGQILFVLIEAIIRRPLPAKVREYIHIGSWLMIMALMIYLTTKDIGICKLLPWGK